MTDDLVEMKKRTKHKKRLSKEQRAIAEAERLAAMLASAPAASSNALAPPAFIADPRLAAAGKFWADHAEQLQTLGTLDRLDRFTFAMFCIYVGEFIAAEDDILAHGYSVKVKTVSGDRMPRENPSVARRDFAAKMILDCLECSGSRKWTGSTSRSWRADRAWRARCLIRRRMSDSAKTIGRPATRMWPIGTS